MNEITLHWISVISFIVMTVLLVVTIILFFVYNIPAVIGDLTGKTARKQVAEIREQNRNIGIRKNVIRDYESVVNNEKLTEYLSEETVLLDSNTELLQETTLLLPQDSENSFIVTKDIVIVHSDKII